MPSSEAIVLPVVFRERECGRDRYFRKKASPLKSYLNKDLTEPSADLGKNCPTQTDWARLCRRECLEQPEGQCGWSRVRGEQKSRKWDLTWNPHVIGFLHTQSGMTTESTVWLHFLDVQVMIRNCKESLLSNNNLLIRFHMNTYKNGHSLFSLLPLHFNSLKYSSLLLFLSNSPKFNLSSAPCENLLLTPPADAESIFFVTSLWLGGLNPGLPRHR